MQKVCGLDDLAGQNGTLSIIGMCKNAGKTTVLNALLGSPERAGEGLALTSVGRDGERRDVVTDTPKPPVYIGRGALAATAEGLLPLCDVTRQIEAVTDVRTPLGRVVVLRALSDGFVQLGGPSMNEQLSRLRELFFALGARRVLIDGAAGRRSLCSREVSDRTLLCTGASLHRDMDVVVRETAHVCKLLTLPELSGPFPQKEGARLVLRCPDGEEHVLDAAQPAMELRRLGAQGVLASAGAVTDTLVDALMRSGLDVCGLTIAAREASQLLLSAQCAEAFQRRGGTLAVGRSAALAAVTVNPVSAYGWRFDAQAFAESMAKAAAVPVLDVVGGWHAGA